MNWKYANSKHEVAYRILEDGTCESHEVSSDTIQEFLDGGGVIDQED